MASLVFDTGELDKFAKQMEKTSKRFRTRQKSFMRKEGNKLKTKTVRQARSIGKKTGNYLKSIKRGKVYKYDGAQAVRVYSTAPHAHLIEDGHRMVTHDGREVGFVKGHHVFEVAGKAFEPQYLMDIDNLLDEAVKEL
ncbi:MAG: HK97 gp10 family phage protein [Dysosmobacter sp.]|uniref:HK97 gp10 family phage protein n=1 Tax=Dysosmobacter sp. TaxID=2591382 RepID=UPI00283DAAB1|nr:HK97 gp10 family phage protein [Dysosmobacter sp.]MDR3984066.1 HK97 gp10 family phage protein [Dysosmobacter sp.]